MHPSDPQAVARPTDFNNQPLPLQVGTLTSVRVGKAMPFTREKASAINKAPIKGNMAVTLMGLVEDEQADRRHHGGPLKAVHQMAVATYERINAQFDLSVRVGELGENLTVTAAAGLPQMDECTVCIGDVYQFGDGADCVQLAVVQPRRPCYKIDDQVGRYQVASWVSEQGIAGWYYQVVKDGVLQHDLPVYLIKRPYPFANLAWLWRISNHKIRRQADLFAQGHVDDRQGEPTDTCQQDAQQRANEQISLANIARWQAIDCLEESWQQMLAKKAKQLAKK